MHGGEGGKKLINYFVGQSVGMFKQVRPAVAADQVIQHKLANCLVNLDATKLLLARASKAYDISDPTWRYMANATCALPILLFVRLF